MAHDTPEEAAADQWVHLPVAPWSQRAICGAGNLRPARLQIIGRPATCPVCLNGGHGLDPVA